MTADMFLALLVFSAIAAYTPGPNNTLLMASGMNFGYRRSLPLVFGVCFGFPLMIACIGLGLGEVFKLYPVLYTVLKFAAVAYMLWLAWKIATATPSSESGTNDVQPMGFIQAVLFQWVNPKGWIVSIAALSAYTVSSSYYVGVAAVVFCFVIMGFTSASLWTMFGASLRHVLNDPRYFRWINYALAALLVASLLPLLTH